MTIAGYALWDSATDSWLIDDNGQTEVRVKWNQNCTKLEHRHGDQQPAWDIILNNDNWLIIIIHILYD